MNRTVKPAVVGALAYVVGMAAGGGVVAQTASTPDTRPPRIEDYATIESTVGGVPVYSFGNLVYIYGQSPDLLPGAVMQRGNSEGVVKIRPKKSWEIKHNLAGCEHEMTVRSPWTDSQPTLPIHLIDGDAETVWSSWGCALADGRPEWIRIDLPIETAVAAVALVCAKDFARRYPPFGAALPRRLEIKLSRDAAHWDTVFQSNSFVGDASGRTEIKFAPQRVKQIWVVGNDLPEAGKDAPHAAKWIGHVFSLGELEVLSPEGLNLALLSRGAGVTVSSTSYGLFNDRFTQDTLWGPLQYDLGNTWTRLGGDNGSFTWNFVELEKGQLRIDPRADESITQCVRNGVRVIMTLDFKGNWRYLNPPRKLHWPEARYRELNDNYSDPPGPVTQSPEMFRAYLKYIDYMVRHFRGRAALFEIGNEWNFAMSPAQYMKDVFAPTYAAIKKADPQAKVMLGSPVGGIGDVSRLVLECLGGAAGKAPISSRPGPQLDAIGWHPADYPNRAYFDGVRRLKKQCEALGFTGRCFATEIYAGAGYPPGQKTEPAPVATEMLMAKYLVRSLTGHSGLDMEAGPCHPHFTAFPHPQSLCRQTWPAQTVVPCQPTIAYYAWRTLATVLDDFYPAEFPVSFSGGQDLTCFTFQSADKTQRLVAVWLPIPDADRTTTTDCGLTLPGFPARKAWGIDIFNGTQQELTLTVAGDDAALKGLVIRDYPTYVRFEK